MHRRCDVCTKSFQAVRHDAASCSVVCRLKLTRRRAALRRELKRLITDLSDRLQATRLERDNAQSPSLYASADVLMKLARAIEDSYADEPVVEHVDMLDKSEIKRGLFLTASGGHALEPRSRAPARADFMTVDSMPSTNAKALRERHPHMSAVLDFADHQTAPRDQGRPQTS